MHAFTEPRLLRDAVDLVIVRKTPYGLEMNRDGWMSSERKCRVFLPLIDAFRVHFTFLCLSIAPIFQGPSSYSHMQAHYQDIF